MPDDDIGKLKTQITKEVKQLAKNTEPHCKKAKPLREEAADLANKKELSDADKKRQIDLRKALQDLEKSYLTQTQSTSDRISAMLKDAVPKDPKVIPEYQKAMAPWYRELIEKEAGLDIGKGLKLSGDISLKDKSAKLILKGHFTWP